MGQVPLNPITEVMSLEQLCNEVAKWQKLLKNVINGDIDFENIRAKGIIADSIDVDKLSAISADLGEIIAGIIRGISIYGSYIATAEGTYPRTEMDVAGNLLAAYQSATSFAKILPFLLGSPAIQVTDGIVNGVLVTTFNTLALQSSLDLLLSASDGDLSLTGNTIYANGVPINSRLSSLQSQIDNLDSRVSALGG